MKISTCFRKIYLSPSFCFERLMDDKTHKERLEQELRFLKESFDADVISKEEFDKGKNRIEKKLEEIQKSGTQTEEHKKEHISENKEKEEIIKEIQKKDTAAADKEGGKVKLRLVQETEEHGNMEPIKGTAPEKTEKIDYKEQKKEVLEGQKKYNKLFGYVIAFLVLTLVVFFSYSFLANNSSKSQEKISQAKFVAICNSNDDCEQEGQEGACTNPGTRDAKCEFKEIKKTNVFILNDRENCFNCDTIRVLNILKEWFGALNSTEIDYNSDEGRKLAEKFDVKLLPIYILDENITKAPRFEQIKQIFVKTNDNYLLSEAAAGSAFYFKRNDIPNKLDLFVITGDNASIKAETNLKEFLEAFGQVKYKRHLSNDESAEELGIKTFPTFLVNNRVRFSGVHTAETIKNHFCYLNKISGCEKNLSASLI